MSKFYNSAKHDIKYHLKNITRPYRSLHEPLLDQRNLTSKNINKEKERLKMENDNRYNEKQWTLSDGVRTIDYVLAWDESSWKATAKGSVERRATFEGNLREEGLELELEYVESTGMHYVKIHTPLETLQRYAEILKLHMPIKHSLNTIQDRYSITKSCFETCFNCFEIKSDAFPEYKPELTEVYTRARDYLFDADSQGFFTPAQKTRIVQFIMERTLYSRDAKSNVLEFGIRRLILHGTYKAAYPLHDGDFREPGTMRYSFYRYWASFKNWYKMQPVDQIRQYFGVRTALYFIWLGYYTRMLIPASIAGVASLIGSLFLLPITRKIDEVCDGEINDVMCPLCDRCKFWNVTDTCLQTEILYVFDNDTTVLFAIFISFWAAVFLEFWKRYSAEITLRWDLTSLDDRDENPRPEYAAKLSKLAADRKVGNKLNFITNATEPRLTFWRHVFPGRALSLTSMLLLVSLAVAAVVGVTLYRMIAMYVLANGMFSSTSATFLNLLCIIMLSPIYAKLSVCLTEHEMHRTQREFDNALTLKMYLLEFINHYSSIFYIAFFKGKFVGPPSGYYRIFGFRQLECGAGGCMFELTQQLAIIMIGKRAYRSIIQVLKPLIKHDLKRRFVDDSDSDEEKRQWEKDYKLDECEARMLFPEYLDMVLQYGFVTIFVSAFPLAPLFALINNIFEIRIDAQKFVMYRRRPTLRRIKDIGVWFDILEHISNLAVFTNGFIIAFTSSFVPRMVYRFTVSPDYGTAGMFNYTLSYMAVQDLDMKETPNTTVPYCRYFDYREPPWSEHKYEETKMFWMVLAARLAFFILFENIIILAVVLVKWLIPDVPQSVKWQMRRRYYLLNEIIINHETSNRPRRTLLQEKSGRNKSRSR